MYIPWKVKKLADAPRLTLDPQGSGKAIELEKRPYWPPDLEFTVAPGIADGSGDPSIALKRKARARSDETRSKPKWGSSSVRSTSEEQKGCKSKRAASSTDCGRSTSPAEAKARAPKPKWGSSSAGSGNGTSMIPPQQRKSQLGGQSASQQQKTQDGGQTPSERREQSPEARTKPATAKRMLTPNRVLEEAAKKTRLGEESAGREPHRGVSQDVPAPVPRAGALIVPRAPKSDSSSSCSRATRAAKLPPPRVNLYTWGRKELGLIGPFCTMQDVKELLRWSSPKGRGRDGGPFNLDLSVKAGRAAMRLPDNSPDPLVFNCRVFREDIKTISGDDDWGHSGLHRTNVRRLFDHNHGATMKDMSGKIHNLVLQRHKSWPAGAPVVLDIGLECNKGRDRSVGMSAILENAFKINGWTVSTKHLCESNWRRNEGCLRAGEQQATSMDPHPHCPYCQPGKSSDLVAERTARQFPSLRFDSMSFDL